MTLALDCVTLCEEVAARGLVNMALYAPRTRENRMVKWTLDTFLRFEETSTTKHELVAGELRELAGGTRDHSLIAGNIYAYAFMRLRGTNCRAFTSDLKVKINFNTAYYPETSIVCGKERFHNDGDLLLVNPAVIVEVTSPSSAIFDRGKKLESYKSLPSVQHISIVDQQRILAELHTRVDDGWQLSVFKTMNDVIHFDALGIAIHMSEIYDGVDLDTIGV